MMSYIKSYMKSRQNYQTMYYHLGEVPFNTLFPFPTFIISLTEVFL